MSRYHLAVTINQVPRFYAYQDQACPDAEAALRALTPAQRLAQTSLTAPAPPTDATWQLRNCNAAASVTAVSCVQVGNTTVITVTATAPCEINITAVSGGAQWGDATSWFPTVSASGTTYTKTWTFLFVAGLYHILARVIGTTDATKYVACDFTATAATGGGGTVPPPSDPGSSADLDALIPDLNYTGEIVVGSHSNPNSPFQPAAHVIGGKVFPYDASGFNPPSGSMIAWHVDGEPFYRLTGQLPDANATHPDYPGAAQGFPIHLVWMVVPTGTAPDQWTASGNPNYQNTEATISPF